MKTSRQCLLVVLFLFITALSKAQQDPSGPIGGVHSTWGKKIITYYFYNKPSITLSPLTPDGAKDVVRAAMKSWQDVANIYFIEACTSSTADMVIRWATGLHGDDVEFDGARGTLGHAYPPGYSGPYSTSLAGDVHFDDAETWCNYGRDQENHEPFDLRAIALHEIGHSLGLYHSSSSTDIMYQYYVKVRELSGTDITRIQNAYGTANNPIIGTSNTICGTTGSETYSFNVPTIPSGYTLTWAANSSSVTLSTSGNDVTVTNNGYGGPLTLTATVQGSCGDPLTFTKEIQVIVGATPTISGTTNMTNCDGGYTFNVNPYGVNNYSGTLTIAAGYGATFTWSVPVNTANYHMTRSYDKGTVTVQSTHNDGTLFLKCAVSDACGNTYNKYITFTTGGCSFVSIVAPPSSSDVNIFPNPTQGVFTITLNAESKKAAIKQVIITNKMGVQIYKNSFKSDQRSQKISLLTKSKDVYTIQVFDGTNWLSKKIVLQ